MRGELGHTFTDALVDLPPSLRFYAGGDRSIRGYNYREVGPAAGRRSGSAPTTCITASTEFEHYFTTQWGGAVFVDSGSAFNGSMPDWHTGVGIGLRWRSPVGPVRVDIAHGLDHPDSAFTDQPQHRGGPVRGVPLTPEQRAARQGRAARAGTAGGAAFGVRHARA